MKKKLFFAASAAVVMLSSCQKELPFYQDDLMMVEFGKPNVALSSLTKAGGLLESTAFPTTWNFKVSAYDYVGNNAVINSDIVSYSTKWSAAGAPYYWPVGNVNKNGEVVNTALKFVAYAPASTFPGSFAYSSAPAISSTGVTGSLAVSKDTANQVDFLYSAPMNFSKGNNVGITFKHGMTNVVFKAKAAAEYGTGSNKKDIQIVSIDLNNVYSQGSFVTTDTIIWTPSNPSKYAINNTKHKSTSFTEAGAASYSAGLTLTTSYQQFGDKHIFIPQSLGAVSGSNAKSATTVDVTVLVNGVTYYYKGIELTSLQNAVTTWKDGSRVTYNMTVGLSEILFDAPVVTDWDDDSSSKQL